MKPRISRVPVPPSLRLGSTLSATTLRPEVQYEAESSTAAQRRQQLELSSPSASSTAARPTWSSGGYEASKERRRRGPKAISLLRAQKFAKALAAATPPSKIDIPLRSTPPSPPTIPTLADLESKRPDREPPHITARSYKKQYQRLYNSIDQAFVAKQIIKLASQLGVNTRKGKTRTKDTAIRGVLETWGWEDPQLAEAIYAAREVQERDWKMSRAELWLMMRDEEFVRPTLDDGIKLSVPVPVAETEGGQIEDTRDLRGRGDPYALAEMDQRIMDRRVIIQQNSRTFQSESGSDIHNDAGLLGTISNATGVYLEPAVQGAIRLVALDSLQLDKAITLLHQAKTHASVRATTPLSLVSSSSNLEMSLFPHIPTSFSAIPWQEIGTLRKPLFRVRGVQPWETKVGMRDVAHREERLGQSLHIGVTGGRREAATLEAAMGQGMGGIQCSTRTARFGHLLFPDASPHASVLVPSKRSSWTADNIGTSPTAQISPVFFPSVPPAIIQFPISGTARTIRRLRYQAVEKSTRFLEISHELPPKPQAETATSMLDTTLEAGSKWHKELDAQMASLGVDEIEVEPEAAGDAGEVSPIQPETPLKIEARVFEEKVENMMMPDRPIDFTMTTSLLPHQIDISDHLAFLQPYLQHLEGSAPTTLELDEQWMLYTAEELDILERDLSAGETELTSPPAGLLLRTVKATDLTLGQGRAVRYAELETEATGDMPSAFWQQLAFWTRAVAPGAGQIRNTFY